METGELMLCNIQGSNLGKYQDAPNFEASEMNTIPLDETDKNLLSAIVGSKFEHRRKCFPEANSQQTFLTQIFLACTNTLLTQLNVCRGDHEIRTAPYAKPKFDTQTAKNGYVRSAFLSCHTSVMNVMSITTTLPKLLRPPVEAVFIEMLRIVDIPADYDMQFERSTIMRFEFLAYTYTVSKAKNGYVPSVSTDLSALQLSHSSAGTSVCTLTSSTLTLARFCESSIFYSRTLIALPTSNLVHLNLHEFLIAVNSLASSLKKILLLYDPNKLSECEMIGFQAISCLASYYIDCINCLMSLFEQKSGQVPVLSLASATGATSCLAVCSVSSLQSCSMYTSSKSIGIPPEIQELLLHAQLSKSDELLTNIDVAIVTDKKRIEGSLLFPCGYIIPAKLCSTSVVIVSRTSTIQSLSGTNGTSVAISRASPSAHTVSSLSFVPLPAVTPFQEYFERCFDILAIMSPQCFLSCVPVHSICTDLDPEEFKGSLPLSCTSSNMQLQISAVSDLGMPKLHQKDLREEVVSENPPRHHSNRKRRTHKGLVTTIRKRASAHECHLHRPDHHYSNRKLPWSQLRGKKMNSISLRKGLMCQASTRHSPLKCQCTETHSSCTMDSQCSLRPKQTSAIPQAIEESRSFDRGIALFRGGESSARRSDPQSATSSDDDSDSDADGGHTGAEASLQDPTSTHETSHSNGAMNVRPSSEAPPPLKMNSGVSQPGGEADRYVQNSQSPAALITKSLEQLLHSQGTSNNYSEPLHSKQASSPGNSGRQDASIQPRLECYEDENNAPISHPQILEQAQEEVSPVLAAGQQNEHVLMRPQHDHNDAVPMQPQANGIENHPLHSAAIVSCPIPLSDSITGPAIVGFGANVEAAPSALPDCRVEAVVNHERQLAVVRRRLRNLVQLMRFRCDRISRLLRRSHNDSYNNQLRVIQHALRDSVHEMHCIHHRWQESQLQFQRIQTLLLHTHTSGDRVFKLQQSSALHTCHSLLRLQPRLEQINSLLYEILSQLQQANAHAAAQPAPHAPLPQPQANPQQAVMLPALLPGPGNVMSFQAQVEEDNGSLVQT